MLESLCYPPFGIAEAIDFIEATGRVAGCDPEVIDPEDVRILEAVVLAFKDSEADRAERGHLERDPADWPEWTDYHVWGFVPTEADARWAAEAFADDDEHEPCTVFPEPAAASWTDFDQMRAFGYV